MSDPNREGAGARSGAAPAATLASLMEDWITIWQSEAAALWADRELHEAMQRGVDAWAAQAASQARAAVAMVACDDAARTAGPAAPPRPAPAAAAPDGRDELVRQLFDRVAELERRLDAERA